MSNFLKRVGAIVMSLFTTRLGDYVVITYDGKAIARDNRDDANRLVSHLNDLDGLSSATKH